MAPPTIPERGSSKRSIDQLKADLPALERKRLKESKTIADLRRALRPSRSIDADYWGSVVELAQHELQRIDTVEMVESSRIAIDGGTDEDWEAKKSTMALDMQRDILSDKIGRIQAFIDHLKSDGRSRAEKATLRSWIANFVGSPLGANANVSAGRRDAKVQSQFRKDVFEAYHNITDDTEPMAPFLAWDVVSADVVLKDDLTASHFFSYRHGTDALIAIFSEAAENDLWSPANGLCLPNAVEKHLEDGIFAICPDLPRNASKVQREEWQRAGVKEYCIRFFEVPPRPKNPKSPLPLYYQPWPDRNGKFGDLDGRRLQFRTAARPKSRYIYFMFLLNLLRFTWRHKEKARQIISSEIGQIYWGSPGAYMRKGCLEGFTNEIGHLLPATDEEILSGTLTSQLLTSAQRNSVLPDEYDESDDEDGTSTVG